MSVINILSPHVADLIAAGEVVERPASVVKELMENAIDAGAENITVEIRGGGMKSIRVTDDGCGMSPEDAGTAFLRHATSKLSDEQGLEAISTLGFRGEALAAISAVSRIELTTRERGADTGTRVLLEAGDIQEMSPAGCPEGTTMLVQDLFYNTPARRKFAKSDRSESGAAQNAALRCALGHPEVSVRFLRDGEEQFFSPGDGQIQSAVYSLLGRETAMGFLNCDGEGDGIRVTGYVSAPHAGRGNRQLQFFFLNGRSFRSPTLQSALEQAYRNNLLSGRYPACVLYLEMNCARADVNVHPTKQEVRFTDDTRVFEVVYGTVRAALEEKSTRGTAEIHLSSGTKKEAAQTSPRKDFFRTMTAEEFRNSGLAEKAARSAPVPVQTGLPLPPERPMTVLPLHQDLQPVAPSARVPRPEIPRIPAGEGVPPERTGAAEKRSDAEERGITSAPESAEIPTETDFVPETAAAEEPVRNPLSEPAAEAPAVPEPQPPAMPPYRVIGEALNTYILVETEGSLLLIDKHACHERINFDRLKAGLGAQMRQTLLTPLTWSPGAELTELLERNLPLLEEAGFELERFGEDGVIVRAVPADLQGGEIAALEEIAEALRNGRVEDPREEVLHTVACKAAIKAGSRSAPAELEVLAAKVVSGEIRYCPHGRPVSVRLTREELDKQFKRIL